jgi:hypothetical protein
VATDSLGFSLGLFSVEGEPRASGPALKVVSNEKSGAP